MAFHVGTSGWQYKHWRGPVYPEDLPVKDWLPYYAGRFQTVEVNNSFYRQPSDETWRRWRDSVPTDFRFAVKASRFISHFKRFKDPQESIDRFIKGVEGLGDRVGPLLYQARPDFARTPENVRRMDAFMELLPKQYDHVLEFRHESWFGHETMEQLERHKVGFCSFDMPGQEVPLVATTDFAYMRFHGATYKYAGNYTEAALKHWANKLRALLKDTRQVWVYFNNDDRGYAFKNAHTLSEMLG